jgi:hypothetical protein
MTTDPKLKGAAPENVAFWIPKSIVPPPSPLASRGEYGELPAVTSAEL